MTVDFKRSFPSRLGVGLGLAPSQMTSVVLSTPDPRNTAVQTYSGCSGGNDDGAVNAAALGSDVCRCGMDASPAVFAVVVDAMVSQVRPAPAGLDARVALTTNILSNYSRFPNKDLKCSPAIVHSQTPSSFGVPTFSKEVPFPRLTWHSGYNGDRIHLKPMTPLALYAPMAKSGVTPSLVLPPANAVTPSPESTSRLRSHRNGGGGSSCGSRAAARSAVGTIQQHVHSITRSVSVIELETEASAATITTQPPAKVHLGSLDGLVRVTVTTASGAAIRNRNVYATVRRSQQSAASVGEFFRSLSEGKVEADRTMAVLADGEDVAVTNAHGVAQFKVIIVSGVSGAYYFTYRVGKIKSAASNVFR